MPRRERTATPYTLTQQEQNNFISMVATQDAARVATGRRSRRQIIINNTSEEDEDPINNNIESYEETTDPVEYSKKNKKDTMRREIIKMIRDYKSEV